MFSHGVETQLTSVGVGKILSCVFDHVVTANKKRAQGFPHHVVICKMCMLKGRRSSPNSISLLESSQESWNPSESKDFHHIKPHASLSEAACCMREKVICENADFADGVRHPSFVLFLFREPGLKKREPDGRISWDKSGQIPLLQHTNGELILLRVRCICLFFLNSKIIHDFQKTILFNQVFNAKQPLFTNCDKKNTENCDTLFTVGRFHLKIIFIKKPFFTNCHWVR